MFHKFGELEKEGISPTMASFSARLMVLTDNGTIWNGIWYLSAIFIPMRNCDDVGRRGYSAAGPRIFICLPRADARLGPWETPVLIGKLFWWSQNHRKSGKFPHLQATYGCWYPKLLAPNLDFFLKPVFCRLPINRNGHMWQVVALLVSGSRSPTRRTSIVRMFVSSFSWSTPLGFYMGCG